MGDVSSVHNLLEYLYGLAFLQGMEMKLWQNNIIFYILIKQGDVSKRKNPKIITIVPRYLFYFILCYTIYNTLSMSPAMFIGNVNTISKFFLY